MDKVAFLPAAKEDYNEAYAWYRERSDRAAIGFEEAVERALREIVEAPTQWPVCDARHRYRLLKRYPYRLIYRVEEDVIAIVAVGHGRRRPRYWEDRD